MRKVVGRERSPNLGYGWGVNLPLERIRLEPVEAVVSVLCSWARHVTLTVPFSTQVYKLVERSNRAPSLLILRKAEELLA